MKAKHHFWSSLVAGGALYLASDSAGAFAGTMIGGFLIDADHAIDQLLAVRAGAPLLRGSNRPRVSSERSNRLADFVRRRKLVRLVLFLHSYELLVVLVMLASFSRTPFLIGLTLGYALHLGLDFARHHHEFRSSFFYLISYRLLKGFRRERLIKPEYQ